ncbi:MAG: hypothetical protein HFJ65_04245 [Eggerthellaceae bacterium]|nr:hypothetical protein [Eggerthellaceae bacterium]
MREGRESVIGRREFLTGAVGAAAVSAAFAITGCSAQPSASTDEAITDPKEAARESSKEIALPPATPDDSQFHVDENINMDSIDNFLGRQDVEYTDMRMIHDPADYAAIGGDSDLSVTVEGFKIVPFPYIGTLEELPVNGAYEGNHLFDIEWNEDGTIASATPRYEESLQILEDLFPKDKSNFIMCGGAGYAHMMTELLKYEGWDPEKVYNVGGGWDYTGYHPQELVRVDDNGETHYYTWRANIPYLDFSLLNPIS